MKPQNLRTTYNIVKQFNGVRASLSLLAAIVLYACSGPADPLASAPPAQTLPVIAINNSSETTFLEYPALIEGAVDLEIRPQISGSLQEIYVSEGALVREGQPIFKINDLPFREELNNAKALLKSAQAAKTNAQLEVNKLITLVSNKVISDYQLKSAEAAYQAALGDVEQAKAGVAAATINLRYTVIKAPVTGAIGRLPKKPGSLVSPSDPTPLTHLSDAHEVHVYFSLSEDDFISFNQKYHGKTAAETIKKIPGVLLSLADNTIYPHEGKLDMIDGQFDKQTGSITLRATFPNYEGVLRSGNTGKIKLSLEHQNVLSVPQESTLEIQDKVFVFSVNKSNKVSKQPITVSGSSGTNYLVTDGLKEGDRIVFKGIETLKEGDTIQPEQIKGLTATNISK